IGFQQSASSIPAFYSHQPLPRDLPLPPLLATQGAALTLTVHGRGMLPTHRVMLNGKEMPTRYVKRGQVEASIPADAIAEAGTYMVTIKSEGEQLPESYPAHLVVKFKQ